MFYGPGKAVGKCSWCLKAADFTSTLAALGYRSSSKAQVMQRQGAGSSETAAEGSGGLPRLHNLRLVVQLLTVVAKAQVIY